MPLGACEAALRVQDKALRERVPLHIYGCRRLPPARQMMRYYAILCARAHSSPVQERVMEKVGAM